MDNNEILKTIMDGEAFLKSYYLEGVPKDVKKLILILFPPTVEITGGLISILNMAKVTRKYMEKEGYFVQMAYYPNYNFFFKYRRCENDENILNFDEVIDNFPDVEELIMHVPECHSSIFLKNLNVKQSEYLKDIKNLQINIMNQNVVLMPSPADLQYLESFTSNITQSTAHHKYTNQQVCDKWGYPLYFVLAAYETAYIHKPYLEKQNIICYSKDNNSCKDAILRKIEQCLPEFQLIEINNLSFEQYKELIATAKYCITFGEGFDGYLSEPILSGSVAFAVYNEEFFPSQEYKEFKNIYLSYQEMLDRICDDIKLFENDIKEYEKVNLVLFNKFSQIKNVDDYEENILRFYKKEPTFLPMVPVKAN